MYINVSKSTRTHFDNAIVDYIFLLIIKISRQISRHNKEEGIYLVVMFKSILDMASKNNKISVLKEYSEYS